MGEIKGFIFDMDGVLTETSENHYLAWKILASSIGIHIDRSLNEALKGISRMDSLEVILNHGGKADAYSQEEKVQLATRKNNQYIEMINNYTEADLLPGVMQFLEALKEKGYKVAIASASHSAKRLVSLLGIDALVDYISDPRAVPGKPAPDIFLLGAKGLGLEPEACVGVEDAVAGVSAIKSAGMLAVGIGDSDVLAQADIIYEQPEDMILEEIIHLSLE